MGTIQRFLRDDSGQAIVEYILLLVAVVSVVGIMKNGIRDITANFWLFMAKRIAAACPTCEPSLEVEF